MFQHALKFLTWFSACLEIFNIVFNTMVHNIGEFQNSTFDILNILGWVQLQFDCKCFKSLCLKVC